jgi:GDPmannose 4,6-dehydratase
VYAYWATINYRESYGIFACNGILFNHESPRRGKMFVTRKISLAVARIRVGLQERLFLGDLTPTRDWGYAPEYVEAMWSMLQQDHPDDYVIATGRSHSVKEFCDEAFGCAGLDWRKFVTGDTAHIRPSEVMTLCGDASKAKRLLGWESKTGFKDLVVLMVREDMKKLSKEGHHNGIQIC